MLDQTREIVAEYRADMARLLEAVRAVPQKLLAEPIGGERWTVVQMLAHIAFWDRTVATRLDEVLAGQPPRRVPGGADAANARVMEASSASRLDDVLADVRSAHESYLARIESLTPEHWELEPAHRWPSGAPVTVPSLFTYQYRGGSHYAGHAAEIEEWLAARSSAR